MSITALPRTSTVGTPAILAASALERVAAIDMAPINKKLSVEAPELWTGEALENAETTYRRFLALHLMFPSEVVVPTKIIDGYWHQHILDTQKYAQDCNALFGGFLHHDPYFGINGEEDREQNIAAFARTQDLWEAAFGEPIFGETNPCKSTDCR